MKLVKCFDQRQWSRLELHEDRTWNGSYHPNPMDYMHLPEAEKMCIGSPVLCFQGKTYTARQGRNVYD